MFIAANAVSIYAIYLGWISSSPNDSKPLSIHKIRIANTENVLAMVVGSAHDSERHSTHIAHLYDRNVWPLENGRLVHYSRFREMQLVCD